MNPTQKPARPIIIQLNRSVLLLAVGILVCAFTNLATALSYGVKDAHQLDDRAVNESSGLAVSGRDPGLLWTHNDSGGGPQLFALDMLGHVQGSIRLKSAFNVDWEDMAAFTEKGVPWLLLADIGDNWGIRPVVDLYLIEEPQLPFGRAVDLQRHIRLRYPDGPRDVEAVAVDTAASVIYLLSKRDAVPQLYRLPLHPDVPLLVVAEALGAIRLPHVNVDQVDRPMAHSDNYITSMDIAPDGLSMVLLNYTRAFLYRRLPGEDWPQALRQKPTMMMLPIFRQIEAVSFAADGASIWISSEGTPAPLARLSVDAFR
jgi:hypothetical protein